MKITFYPEQISVEALQGETLLAAAARADVLLEASCGGKGSCGKCRVQILSGDAGPLDQKEEKVLTSQELKEGIRLACHVVVRGEGELRVGNLQRKSAAARKSALIKLPEQFVPDADNGENGGFGVAVDIGTTTVVGMCWDLERGALAGIKAVNNPQGIFGADVISRISYASESEEALEQVHRKIIDCINEMIRTFTADLGIQSSQIRSVTIVGNTTMSHLFLGISPESLAVSPFEPVFTKAQDRTAGELGIQLDPAAKIHLLPNIAGHVGSDITAGVLATGLRERKGLQLFLDVGTNGELVLTREGETLTASTAAGPAFEGARIQCGMRAADGAIERVWLRDGDLLVQVIGERSEDTDPLKDDDRQTEGAPQAAGICGSGLIDAIACMLEAGVLEPSGRMLDEKTALDRGISPAIASRLQSTESGRHFVLAAGIKGQTVFITQKDVRELQLAKGAIYAGIQILVNKLGAAIGDIDQITIAGAFGNYIDQNSAMRIGLLPKVPLERIDSAGNTAGIGVSMALLSKEACRKADEIAERMEHVELSAQPDFQNIYMNSMMLSPNSEDE